MKGQKVVVKTYGGIPYIMRVWDANKSHVYVIEENEYKKRVTGSPSYDPVGFPIRDVFEYSDELQITENFDWSELARWRD